MDLRILSTIERIKLGLFECIEEKPFRLINNNDIINKAEISSRTFYRYFKDKNDLLDRVEDTIITELKDALEQISFDKNKDLSLRSITTKIMITVLYFCSDHKDEIKILLSENGDLSFWYKLKKAIDTKFKTTMQEFFDGNYFESNQNKLIFDSFVGSKIVFIIDWLNCTDTISIQDAEKMLEESTINLK